MKKLALLLIIMALHSTAFAQKDLQLADFTTNGTFMPKGIPGLNPMSDGEHYSVISENRRQILVYSYKTGLLTDTIFNLDKLDSNIKRIDSYAINAPGNWMLIATDKKPIYRNSFTADYYLYEFRNRDIMPLSEGGSQSVATFSPTGEKVAFVRNNNIYIHDIRFHSELKITKDGEKDIIINGMPDWVYEEEFEFNRAFEWAPDGSALAYIKFNEESVKEYNMTTYTDSYPVDFKYKYPMPGEANSKVSVHVYDCFDRTTFEMNIGQDTNIYIPRIRWTNDPKRLAIFTLNRRQNKFTLFSANVRTGETSVIYREENPYYINNSNFDALTFMPDGQSMVVINETNHYRQLQQFSMSGKLKKNLTPGSFDVIDYYGYDPVKMVHYYSSYEESPLEKHIYSIDAKGIKKRISTNNGWNEVSFSKGYSYYILTNSSTTQVPTYSLYTNKGKKLRTLENNAELAAKISEYNMPTKQFSTLKAADGITDLNVQIIKPSDFNANKRYPVLIAQYSGPYSQQVTNKWNSEWLAYVAQQGVIIVYIDPRGTGGRGEAFGKSTYMQLGKLESDDMIASAKQLAELPWVNKDKIGIWGWSYGGFMAALSTLKGSDVFSMGIAVAPVTNFRFYDSIYTERYMREPGENQDGYDNNSPIAYADNLKGNLLIIHGTGDDNVHVSNTYQLAEALTQAGKDFDMAIYRNRNHGIFGGNTTKQLYSKFVKYIETHLIKE